MREHPNDVEWLETNVKLDSGRNYELWLMPISPWYSGR